MAAGLGFKTFNTGDVLSAADTNGFLMQGVLVFANAAARSAAITSPHEGQTSYLKDTDVIQVYSGSAWVTKSGGSSPLTTKGDLYTYSTTDARLPVGTNGHTLVADSAEVTGLKWAAPASGGGMTLLSTTTLSGSSTTVSSIDQTYNSLFILVRRVNMSSTGTLRIRPNGTATSTQNSYVVNATVARVERGELVLVPTERQLSNGETFNGFSVQINDYANTNNDITRPFLAYGQFYRSDDSLNSINNAGGYFAGGAITSIEIIGSGTFSGGTMLIYGVK